MVHSPVPPLTLLPDELPDRAPAASSCAPRNSSLVRRVAAPAPAAATMPTRVRRRIYAHTRNKPVVSARYFRETFLAAKTIHCKYSISIITLATKQLALSSSSHQILDTLAPLPSVSEEGTSMPSLELRINPQLYAIEAWRERNALITLSDSHFVCYPIYVPPGEPPPACVGIFRADKDARAWQALAKLTRRLEISCPASNEPDPPLLVMLLLPSSTPPACAHTAYGRTHAAAICPCFPHEELFPRVSTVGMSRYTWVRTRHAGQAGHFCMWRH